MHKLTNTLPLLTASALFAATASTQAATWFSVGNNQQIDDVADWDDTSGGGGTNPTTAMNVANTDTWVIENGHRMNRGASTAFFGTLQVDNTGGTNDSEFLNRGGSSFQAIVLNGGALNNFRSPTPITALTVNVTTEGGILGAEDDPSLFGLGSIAGSADILVQHRSNGAPQIATSNDGRVVMQSGTNYSGFTGNFVVQSDTSAPGFGFLTFEQDISTPSFGLELQIGGTYTMQNDVSVTSAMFGATSLTPGTYNFTDLTNAGLGGFVEDQSGTLTIIPEPGSAALFALGFVGFLLRRRR